MTKTKKNNKKSGSKVKYSFRMLSAAVYEGEFESKFNREYSAKAAQSEVLGIINQRGYINAEKF